ncbi:MAG TPA: histidine kinase [Pseudonocardiaceae bacterium]|nr:histidine kinase [Pseudonocardiaceae bacterium]
MSVVICGDGAVVLVNLWNAHTPPARYGLAVVLLAAMLSVQLFHFSRRGARLRSPLSYTLLGGQVCLAYLPFLLYGQYWDGVPSFLAGSLLLALPAIPAATGFAATVAGVALIQAWQPGTVFDVPYISVTVATFGLEIYLLTRLAGLVGELDEASTELAQLAVAQERLRFARDLHDLLGLSLSAITLKGELAHRLLYKYPAQARTELSEIVDIARRALADVRSVAGGYQELSLEEECRSAESVLSASNIAVRLSADYEDLPAAVRTVLGAVLREGATNVLRHSKAEQCDILIARSADTVTLDIVNDGLADETPAATRQGGSGTLNVSERVAALNGSVASGVDEDGRHYRLHVTIPLPAEAPAPPPRPKRVSIIRPVDDGDTRAEDYPDPESSVNGWPIRTMIALVFVGMTVSAGIHLVAVTHNGLMTATGLGYLAALLALQLAYANRPNALRRSGQAYALLFVQAALIFLPMLQLGDAWVSLPGFLVGSALLVLPPVAGWTVLALSVGVTAWHFALAAPADVAASAANVIITGLVVFGLTSLSRLVEALNAARTELAKMAIAKERLMFTQDLHQLLGNSLSAISINTEVTRRLMDGHPERAMHELTEILRLARQALSDVRSVATGYRELSLEDESRSARSVLSAADVEVRMNVHYEGLPVLVRTVLAVVLREGVTNVLRHSKALHCKITIVREHGQAGLEIVNDGVTDNVDAGAVSGAGGLGALALRLRRVNGELSTGRTDQGWFRLRATIPVVED